MPPTYSPFWKPFELLARIGAVRSHPSLGTLTLGSPLDTDATDAMDWTQLAGSAKLFDAWGPPDDSPWSAYHRPTLFAALDALPTENVGPRTPTGFRASLAPHGFPAWTADERTAVLLDLPGPVSVAYGALLAVRSGAQPVATFNNWPHDKGLVDAGSTLAALLSFAPLAHDAEARAEGTPPPVLMLDAGRLGARPPVPTDFDNRYYLMDSDLPTAQLLANHGVERVAYVRPVVESATPFAEMDDINSYLFEMGKRLRIHVAQARVDGWGLGELTPYTPSLRKTPFNTVKDPSFRGFRRAAAGGFGVLVPDASRSYGGGGFG